MLTGCRRSEIAGLRWDEIADEADGKAIVLSGARTKTGSGHHVPLSAQGGRRYRRRRPPSHRRLQVRVHVRRLAFVQQLLAREGLAGRGHRRRGRSGSKTGGFTTSGARWSARWRRSRSATTLSRSICCSAISRRSCRRSRGFTRRKSISTCVARRLRHGANT